MSGVFVQRQTTGYCPGDTNKSKVNNSDSKITDDFRSDLLLTQLPLEFTEAAESGGDELAILGLHILQDVLPVQTEGIRGEKRAVDVS